MMKLFIYGTLRKGERNHPVLRSARCVAEQASIPGELYDTRNGYPALTSSKHKMTIGEIYTIDESILQKVDELEGYRPNDPHNLYERFQTNASTDNGDMIDVWAYRAAGNGLTDGKEAIPFGDWKVYKYLLQDSLLYFAYGSCMDEERFKIHGVAHYFQDIAGKGTLVNYTMQFIHGSSDGGKADIVEMKDTEMEGIVYNIPPEALDYLYKREGVYNNGYRPAIVEVTINGKQREALTFTSVNKVEETAPTKKYATEIIRGGRPILSETYIAAINDTIMRLTGQNV